MIYHVTARLIEKNAGRLLARLADGSIGAQRPDGAEIVAALARAVVNEAGEVEWSETCYCPTPLAHERETVLDDHFEALTAREIDAPGDYAGRPFMAYLAEVAAKPAGA
jgi:hypothetical protein